MKDALQLFSRYNAQANAAVHKVLAAVSPQSLLYDQRGSYFQSIIGLLNHVVLSDLVWLSRFKSHYPGVRSLEHRLLPYSRSSLTEIRYETLDSFREARVEVDELISAVVDELDEERLVSQFTYTNSKGLARTLDLGGALLHMFNHQTHHRGAIAQVLDELGVENDYSNLLATVVMRNRS